MVGVTRNGSVAIVRFDDPSGCLTRVAVERLTAELVRLADDRDIRVVILTGSRPGVFIRHYDVEELADAAGRLRRSSRPDAEIAALSSASNPVSTCFEALERLPQPTIAAINGFCQGGGYELALCCDFRIAAAGDYRIGLPEVYLGMVPGGGATQRLPRLVGEARALDLILRGRALDPQDALRMGLVGEVVPDALARSRALADELCVLPRATLAAAKRLIRQARDTPTTAGLAEERATFALLLRGEPEVHARATAFLGFDGEINAFIAQTQDRKG